MLYLYLCQALSACISMPGTLCGCVWRCESVGARARLAGVTDKQRWRRACERRDKADHPRRVGGCKATYATSAQPPSLPGWRLAPSRLTSRRTRVGHREICSPSCTLLASLTHSHTASFSLVVATHPAQHIVFDPPTPFFCSCLIGPLPAMDVKQVAQLESQGVLHERHPAYRCAVMLLPQVLLRCSGKRG